MLKLSLCPSFFPKPFYLGSFCPLSTLITPVTPGRASTALVSEPASDSGCRAVIAAVPTASHSLSQTLPPALCGEAKGR